MDSLMHKLTATCSPAHSPSHHHSQDVLRFGLIVQPVGRVHHTSARIDPEQPHAGWVHATIDGEAQAGALVGIGRPEPQQLQVKRCVLRNTDVIGRLREDGRVVVAVLNSNEHLERQGNRGVSKNTTISCPLSWCYVAEKLKRLHYHLIHALPRRSTQ